MGVFDAAVMHVPIETAREAREVARQLGADCAVAVGGGSTTGLGKAIALDSSLPILAIPIRLLAGAVAYSRVHLGVHYPGDVAVGSIVGSGIAAMIASAGDRIAMRRPRSKG